MRSASRNTASMSCSTSSSVMRARMRSRSAIMFSDSSGPMPAIGSSKGKTRGGAGGERQTHFERTLLAVRERARDRSLAPGEPDFAGDGSGFVEKRRLCRDGPPEREARAASRLHRQREVVEHGKALEHAGDLMAAGEAGAHPVVLRGARDVLTFEKDCA